MPRYNTDKIVYAVGVVQSLDVTGGVMVGATNGKIQYGTVQRVAIAGTEFVKYEIINRAGDVLNVDADSIDALINALIKARNPII